MKLPWKCLALAAGLGIGAAAGIRNSAAEAATRSVAAATRPGDYFVERIMSVPGDGLWNNVALGPDGKFLYVPRMKRTLVVEVASGKVVSEIMGGIGAVAVTLVPDAGRGFISHSKDATVCVFDLKSNAVLGKIPVAQDPGAMIYDPASKRILVSCGFGRALVSIDPNIDMKTAKADDPIDLGGQPDGLVSDGQGMVYVTLKDRDVIAVVDMRERKVATRWELPGWTRPTAIAMDRLRSRLFIGCKMGMVIASATDGHELGEIPLGLGGQGLEFSQGHALVACTDGLLAVIGQAADGAFEVQQKLQMSVGAKSMVADARSGTVYIPGMEMDGKRPAPGTYKIQVLEKK